MIIGISGKIGSGKDTVGQIIQYLSTNSSGNPFHKTTTTFKDFCEGNWSAQRKNCEWEIKKFAGKLKQIVSILTGIPVEDLEKQEVKDKVLGEEWWYYTNTLFNTENKELVPYLEANKYIHNSTKWYIIKPTVRQMLQLIGTEAMRDVIHPNCWCISLFSDYIKGDTEIWKNVKGYEQYYQISNFGRVKRKARKSIYGDINKGEYHNYDDLILRPTKSGYYLTVKFLNKQTVKIHRLVAEHFIQNTENKPYVNHIDQNPLNNFYKNLEWCTQSENIIAANKAGNGNIGEKQSNSKLDEEKVLKIKELLKTNIQQKEIAKMFNVGQTTITDIKKGRKWNHVGIKKQQIASIFPKFGSNWIITDVRFPNEVEAIKNRDGIIIRVNRNDKVSTIVEKQEGQLVSINHRSETILDNVEFDYLINNDSTIEELIEKIKEVLIKEKII